MASLNKVFLMGNLTRDPELRYSPNGTPLCEFRLAMNRKFTTRDGEQRDETCFVDVTMWGRRAEVISEYFTKGSPIFIEGRLKLDTWETAEGRRSKHSVVAENFEFVGSGRPGEAAAEGGADSASRSGRSPRPAGRARSREAAEQKEAAPDEPEQGEYDVSDDEIPF